MNLYFRVIFLLMRQLFLKTKQISIFDSCTTTFFVNPLDLDINFHMNNGRYLSLMDLGRTDLMIKAGIFWKLLIHGYYPLVASESIRFKKSLMPFQVFKMMTKIESLDGKYFFITQKFFRDNELYAEGCIKGLFKKRGRIGSIPTNELFSFLGLPIQEFPVSEIANRLNMMEELLANKLPLE